MKVLFISSSRKGKGISPLVFRQGESLKKIGLQLDYYLIEGSGAINYIRSIWKIKKKLNEDKYSIIHGHYGYCGIISYLAKGTQVLVVSFMGGDLLGLVDSNGAVILKSKLISLVNIFFADHLTDYNIVKSANLKEKIKSKKTSIIPNGVDLKTFYPIDKLIARQKLKISEKANYILFCSSPNRPEKNYKLFSDAVSRIDVSNLQIGHLNGYSSKKVMLYLNAVDVLVMTSFFEGSPNVIKEALACNCPIVSTNVGDVKERIKDVDNCFICGYDPVAISQKILSILNAGKRSNGREKIKSLDINIIATEIKMIYKNLLGYYI